MNFNSLCKCPKFAIEKRTEISLYKQNKFKPSSNFLTCLRFGANGAFSVWMSAEEGFKLMAKRN